MAMARKCCLLAGLLAASPLEYCYSLRMEESSHEWDARGNAVASVGRGGAAFPIRKLAHGGLALQAFAVQNGLTPWSVADLSGVPRSWGLSLRGIKTIHRRVQKAIYRSKLLADPLREVALMRFRILDPSDILNVKRQIDFMQQFGGRPGFLEVYAASPTDNARTGDDIYVMLQAAAGNLFSDVIVKPFSVVPLARRMRLFVEVARAVRDLAMEGIAHRDIKPGNVLLLGDCSVAADCDAVLSDLEFARTTLDSVDVDDDPCSGTPAYMAPEVFASAFDGVARDVWSLGILLYELVMGRLPDRLRNVRKIVEAEQLHRESWEIESDDGFKSLAQDQPQIALLLRRMLDRNANTRISAASVAEASERIARSLGASLPEDHVRPPQKRPWWRRWRERVGDVLRRVGREENHREAMPPDNLTPL